MSTPGRAELVAALQGMVDESGLSRAEVAERARVSPSTLFRWLRDGEGVTPAVARKLAAATGHTGTDAEHEAVRLAEEYPSGNAARVVLLPHGSATSQRRWREEAQQAARVDEYAMTMPSGFLQTRRYARAIFSSSGAPDAQVRGNVGHRLASQELLDDPDHRFVLVMPEGVLRWPATSAEVMREQLAHIAEVARRDTDGRVRIGIIPSWQDGIDVFPMTNFTVYDRRVVVIGTDFGVAYLDQRPHVEFYLAQLDRLAAFARWDADAAVECERIAADYAG